MGWAALALAIVFVFLEPTTAIVLYLIATLLAVVGVISGLVSALSRRPRRVGPLVMSASLLAACIVLGGLLLVLIDVLEKTE